MNYNSICRTFRYTSTDNNYAKIFSIKTHDYGINNSNDGNIIFKLIHCNSESCIIKKYNLLCFKGINNDNSYCYLKDLSKDIYGIECVYTITDNVVDVYVKGSLVGQDIKVIVEQANNISLFSFKQLDRFTNTLNDKIIYNATVDNDIYFQRELYISPNTYKINAESKGYFKIASLKAKTIYSTSSVSFLLTKSSGANGKMESTIVSVKARNIDGNSVVSKISMACTTNSDNALSDLSIHTVDYSNYTDIYIKCSAYDNYSYTLLSYRSTSSNNIEFYNNVNPEDAITPSESVYSSISETLTLTTNFTALSGFSNNAKKVSNVCEINFNATCTTCPNGTVITTTTVKPPYNIQFLVICKNTSGVYYSALGTLYMNGNIQLRGVTDGSEIYGHLDYIIS